MKALDFEAPLDELYSKIDELKRLSSEGQVDLSNEIQKIEERAEVMKTQVYSNLTPSQIIQMRVIRIVRIPCL